MSDNRNGSSLSLLSAASALLKILITFFRASGSNTGNRNIVVTQLLAGLLAGIVAVLTMLLQSTTLGAGRCSVLVSN